VTDLPLAGGSGVVFSPNGRWLASDCLGVRLWTVGTWHEVPWHSREPIYRPAFSPDSRMIAGETFDGAIQLIDPVSGQEYARLDDPRGDVAQWCGFAPDGRRLVTLCVDSNTIHVWDLRALRQELASRDLDLDMPASSEPDGPVPTAPLQVEVVLQ
jgi:WD40 repeat protein